MRTKLALTALTTCLFAAQASAKDKIAMNCSGEEVLQVGNQAPITGVYSHYVSMDLTAGFVCYDNCRAIDTYKIADSKSDPIKIADVNGPANARHISYDTHNATLNDQSEIVMGSIKTKSTSTAKCQTAAFREPPSTTLSK